MAVAQLPVQEEGWPLGLQPLNVRPVHVVRNGDFSGSASFNTLISGSPTSASSCSSDLDTESTGSFFHDRSATLGSLIGVRSILDLSKRSLRGGRRGHDENPIKKKQYKPKTWLFFSLCSRETTDADVNTMVNSLGHFLEEERRARRRNDNNSNQSPTIYGPDGFPLTTPRAATNSLFVDGHIAPPRQPSPKCLRKSAASSRCGGDSSVMLSCICGTASHRI